MKLFYRILSLSVLLTVGQLLSAQSRDFTFANSAKEEGLFIENSTRSGLQMRHSLKQMSLVEVTDNGYSGEVIEAAKGIFLPADAGTPDLPATSHFVAIPNGANARLVMGYRSMTTIQDVDILAAAPIPFDTDDTPNIHEKDLSIYDVDAFYPAQPVTVSEPFSLRGVEAVALTVIPYQYNPVTKELRVYDDLQFSVEFDGGNGDFGDERLRSPYWDPILMQNLVNYNQLPVVDYEARMQQWATTRPTGCEYLIVIPNNEDFRPYANQLKEYRLKQGIITEVKSLSEMECSNTNQMKSYFHNAYNTWDIPPVAVCLFGDHNTNMSVGIPAEYTYHSSSYGNCITDNGYADVTGDNLPEMAFSRLVAANGTEAQMMVSKQIEYEYTNPNMNASTYDQPITALGWQTERWFQICSEVVGGYWRLQGKHPVRINAIYQGNPGSTWSTAQNTNTVVNYFGPNGRGYIPFSPSELGGWTGGTASQVVQAVNNGCMLLQHRDHGYYQGWGEPDFSNSNVSQMNNVGKLTFVNTINCQTGTFDYNQNCLIEAFMRRTYNGQNAGAVGCIGPTQTSYSFVNDAYAWGMYDQYDPQFMPDYGPYANYSGNWRPAFGNVAGKYFLQQSSWPYNGSSKAITHKMFTAHCDAFLQLYTRVPQTLAVTHDSQIFAGATSIHVSATAGATIAITKGGNTILAVVTATGGNQNINIPGQSYGTVLDLVVTKQDYLRHAETLVVNSARPVLSIEDYTVNGPSSNGHLNYGETASFSFTITNSGIEPSTTTTATLTTDTPDLVTILNGSTSFAGIGSGQSLTIDNVFSVHVADNIQNMSNIEFNLHLVSGSDTWDLPFTTKGYAPDPVIMTTFAIQDDNNGNGRLDAGETAELVFTISNQGGTTIPVLTSTLTTNAAALNITAPTVTINEVGSTQTVEATYHVAVASDVPMGQNAEFVLSAEAGEPYTASHSFNTRMNLPIEYFQNGDLTQFNWTNDAEHPWTISNQNPQHGIFCLQSGEISNNQTSSISIEIEVLQDDQISFFRRTSTEANDKLYFYIDGTEKVSVGGTQGWREYSTAITAGTHTLTWSYKKNATNSQGDDKVYIDFITFPPMTRTVCVAGADQAICYDGTAELHASAVGYTSMNWSTNGDGSFDDATLMNTIYTPGTQDVENGEVTLTFSIVAEDGSTLSDDLVLTIYGETMIITESESYDICDNGSLDLSEAHIDIVNAHQLAWATYGDGSFDNEYELETSYTPGEEDLANGQVTLILRVTSAFGCNSAEALLNLNIHPTTSTEFNQEYCGTFNWNGTLYEEDGDYTQTLTSAYGCDSIVTMHFTIIDHSQTVDFDMISCGAFTWNDEVYDTEGDYTQLFADIHGCDSTVTIHLTIDELESLYINNLNDTIDTYYTSSSELQTLAFNNATQYDWILEPSEAGQVVSDDINATITWSESYTGPVTVSVKASNECGEEVFSQTILVKSSASVGESHQNMRLYPNPAEGYVNVAVSTMKDALIEVYNVLGERVLMEQVDAQDSMGHRLDISSLKSGLYLVKVSFEGQTTTCNLIVK